MLVLIASLGFGGVGCGSVYRGAYCAPVTYATTPCVAPIVNTACVEPVVAFTIVPREAAVGYFKVADSERELQLQIIRQQTVIFEQQFRHLNEENAQLKSRILQLPPIQTPLPQQRLATPPPPGLDLASAGAPHSGINREPGARVLANRCSYCHAGEAGRSTGWVFNAQLAATPTWKDRIRIKDAVTRERNRMPQGGSLSEQELRDIDLYCQFDPAELVDAPQGLAKK